MAYGIGVDGSIVVLEFTGRGDYAEHVASRDKVFELCRENGIRDVLVDIRDAQMNLSTRELYEFGKGLAEALGPQEIRFAVLIRDKDRAPDTAAAIAQAKNVDLRVFLEADEARDWLTS